VALTPFAGVIRTLGLILVVLSSGGCQPDAPLQGAGLALSLPDSWRAVEPSTWMVPGSPLAAWSGPEGSSLVVYRTLPMPGGSAAMIAEGLANRLTNLPGLALEVKRTEEVGGFPAARVEVVAPGTGDALAPSGVGTPLAPAGKTLQPTRQVTLAFARSGGPLFISWHMPESAHPRLVPEIESTLKSLKLSADDRRSSYSY
jgi:hypothetical protein